MLTDKQLEQLIEPLLEIYQCIETELFVEVAKRFANYDEIAGSLEWQLKMLDELSGLNADALKIFSKYSNKTEKELEEMFNKAVLGNFNMTDLKKAVSENKTKINLNKLLESPTIARVIKNSTKSMEGTFKTIKTNALESTKQEYMDILNQAHLEVSSGIYSYDESIKRGIKKMVSKGITGATYKRKDGRTIRYSIESCVRRDTLTAVNQTACQGVMESLNDLDTDYVEVSSHLGARVSDDPISNHAGWQGKVYKVNGSDDEYENLVEATGYGSIEGLAGVNCRHRMFPFFVGISKPSQVQYDSEENRKQYELEQKQRKLERAVRNAKKERECMKAVNDEEGIKEAKTKENEAIKKLINFCDENGLRRNPSRERVEMREGKMNVKYRIYTNGEDVLEEYLENATPNNGCIDYEKNYPKKDSPTETEIANILHKELGGDIYLINDRLHQQRGYSPDAVWCENYWEFKCPTSYTAVDTRIRKGLKQIVDNPGGIVLNLSDNLDMKKVIETVNHRMQISENIDFSVDIILIQYGKIKHILSYHK